MKPPFDDPQTAAQPSNLKIAAIAALVVGPVLLMLACAFVSLCAFIFILPASLAIAFWVAIYLSMLALYGLKTIYLEIYLFYPILCLAILPAIVVIMTDYRCTARTIRFALYAGGSIAAASLVRFAGAEAFIGWFAALNAVCAAFAFETAPRLVMRWKGARAGSLAD